MTTNFPFDLEREGKTLALTVHLDVPWWAFWRARSVKIILDRHRALWLYQALHKFAADLVSE